MLEKQFQTRFNKWAKHNIKRSSAFELKVSKKLRMPLSDIRPHQIENLLSARNRKLIYKIEDSGFSQKPFDCFALVKSDAFLVILFYLKRGDKRFHMIDINVLERWIEEKNPKSMTVEDAISLASVTADLK